METIHYKGKMYIFPNKNNSNNAKMNNERQWFIVKHLHKGTYEYINNISYIWMNHKFFELEYAPEIMSALNSVLLEEPIDFIR